MNNAAYQFSVENQALRFYFESIGRKSQKKAVVFSPTDLANFFALALVDVYSDGSFDDLSVSDNGDMEKVLITVFSIFSIFFRYYPDAVVFFEGSTNSRTRLYRMALSHELAQINKRYNVWGITEHGHEVFEKNHHYIGFLLSLKNTNIA